MTLALNEPRSRERHTAASTAPMPNARPRHGGQAPKLRGGAPKAQGLTAAIAVAAPSPGAVHRATRAQFHRRCGFVATSTTLRIYTSLTDVTFSLANDC